MYNKGTKSINEVCDMTNEQKARMKAMEAEMECGDMTNFDEWSSLNDMLTEEYVQQQLPKLKKFFDANIKGKSRGELNPVFWDAYSDWHKDVFGHRPRSTEAFGV